MPISYPPLIDEQGRRTDKSGLEICGAKLRKKDGLYCNRSIGLYPSNRRCKLHGGKSLKGIAHGRFKTGQSSKYLGAYLRSLPQRMLNGVQASLEDPQLLELNAEIAIVQERAADLMKRVDNGESGHLWKQLKAAFVDLSAAYKSGDKMLLQMAMDRMSDLIERGTTDYQGWEEISRQFDRKQRLAESQRKRQIEMGQLAPADQTLLVIQSLLLAVRECVVDAAIREAIQRKISTILESNLDSRGQPIVVEGRRISEEWEEDNTN